MQMLRSLITKYRGTNQPANALTDIISAHDAEGLSHHTSIARWHTDCRPPVRVVLLHGLYSSGSVFWNDFMRAVNDFPTIGKTPTLPTQLYALDLRDHGRSAYSKNSFDLVQACADVAGFIKGPVCDGHKVYLVGHGIGGYIASMIALAYPSLCHGVASLNSNVLQINPRVSPATTISLSERSADGVVRSDIQGSSESVRLSNCGEFIQAINSQAASEKMLEKIFLDKRDRESFLSSALSLNKETQRQQWQCNITEITRFDIERQKNALDAAICENASVKTPVSYLRITDKLYAIESHDFIQEKFPKAKSILWDDFGGKHAESAMALRRPADTAQNVFQHFKLLEDDN